MALITFEDVRFSYEGKTVVENLNFAVNRGDYCCIVGENGSGKTTLIKGLLGLLAPAGGKILFGEGLRGRDIGYLPQEIPDRKDFPAGVGEIVLSGCLGGHGWRPFYTREEKSRADGHMDRLGILDLKKRSYRELSGGQRQRVLLARALCAAREVLVLDEPVAGLDPVITRQLYELIGELNRETGLTLVIVSHDIGGILRYADHILHLREAQIFFGKTADYRRSEVGRRFIEGGNDV